MISDASANRYYYIFDSREQRPVIMDRTTGQEYARAQSPRAQLVTHVQSAGPSGGLRRFARWCACEVGVSAVPTHTPTGRLWAAARQDEASAWQRAREETKETILLAVVLGLPRKRAEAARVLVAHACTDATSARAALDAAHMSERWAEFCAGRSSEAAARDMRRKQVDWLLDVLS